MSKTREEVIQIMVEAEKTAWKRLGKTPNAAEMMEDILYHLEQAGVVKIGSDNKPPPSLWLKDDVAWQMHPSQTIGYPSVQNRVVLRRFVNFDGREVVLYSDDSWTVDGIEKGSQ